MSRYKLQCVGCQREGPEVHPKLSQNAILCKSCFCDESCPQHPSLAQEKPMMSCPNNKLIYVHMHYCGFLLVPVTRSALLR